MKILIVTHYFYPHTGGIELVAYNQAKKLIEKGHEVTVLTSRLMNDPKIAYREGIRIRRIKAFNLMEKWFGIPYPFFSWSALKTIREEVGRHDVVHIHGHVYMLSVIATFYAKKLNKRSVVTQHNTFINYKNILFRKLESAADATLGKYTLSNAKKVIAVSEQTNAYVKQVAPTQAKTVVSYNGIDIDRFNNNLDVEALKSKWQLEQKFVCLTVRRITYKNGIDTLLQVADKLKSEEDIMLLVGGVGPDLERLRGEVRLKKLNNILFLGFIDDKDLPKYYGLSHVFILPSQKGEGMPLVVLEAFASGIPVIATKSGGHEEIITSGKNGYLVDVADADQIANRILQLYNDKKLLKKVSDNCRKLAEDKFSWEDNVAALEKIYKEVESL